MILRILSREQLRLNKYLGGVTNRLDLILLFFLYRKLPKQNFFLFLFE